MKNKILEILKRKGSALNVNELNDELGLNSVDELKDLIKELTILEKHYEIYRTKKNRYMLFDNSHLRVGKLVVNKKGFGFVDINSDEDIYVHGSNMNGALHGDKVIVELINYNQVKQEGRILKIIDRQLENLVGEFYTKKNKSFVKLDNDKIKIKIEIDKKNRLGAIDGHKVLVKVTNKINDNLYRGQIIKIIGHKNDPGTDILSIAAKYNINDKFSKQTMKEANNIKQTVTADEIKNRKDLREKIIFTIDGNDTKDIDDALSLEINKNGNFILGVHIADVSYYVHQNSKIDEEAYHRGTSVYLADRVIPMLPHSLSNGICSLNEGEDRLTISCVMEIDHKGSVVNYDIFESVIRSKKQMTYDEVNQILEKGNIPSGYESYINIINNMNKLSEKLKANKDNRGFIDFEIEESKIIVDKNGQAIDVVLRERGPGEKIIENFMIVTNETVASAIYYMELPFLYRVHGKPKEEKIETFLEFLKILGYKVHLKVKQYNSKTVQDILDYLKEKKEFPILSRLMLRSMQKAYYDKDNIGHFGIASECYTHFTAPIRRYPDITVHRLLKTYLINKKFDTNTINYWDRTLVYLGEHTSEKERGSIECEREVSDMKKAEYMMEHIGEKFTGMISSVMSFGLFIELPNLIEGLVRIEDLKGDKYYFDEKTFSIKGFKNKRGYMLGDKVDVIVKGASKEARTVDFIIESHCKKDIND